MSELFNLHIRSLGFLELDIRSGSESCTSYYSGNVNSDDAFLVTSSHPVPTGCLDPDIRSGSETPTSTAVETLTPRMHFGVNSWHSGTVIAHNFNPGVLSEIFSLFFSSLFTFSLIP